MMSNRPETDAAFLQILCGREHILHRLAVTDLRQRRLGQEATQAIASLGDITLRIRRGILFEALQRATFLYNWSCAHPHVASVTSWDDLVQQVTAHLQDSEVTAVARERRG